MKPASDAMAIRRLPGALRTLISGLSAGPARRRARLVVAVLTLTVCLLALMGAFCMDVLSSARAYVGGESLWSKGQKDAVRHLIRYAESRDAEEWGRYRQAIAIPLGDRVAREELEKPQPDLAAVRRGFLEGGIHPDDVPGMIRLFRWFRHVEFLDRAIGIWAEGDRLVAQVQQAADELHGLVLAGSGGAALRPALARIELLDQQLTPLEVRFSDTLGEASRKTQWLLTAAVAAISGLLILFGTLFVRRMAARAARYEEALRQANAGLEERVAERTRELTEANARLVQVDRLKSEFLATMSHELRTPLNGILGLSGLLRDGSSGPVNEEQKRQLGLVHASGQRLLELIEDVLDLSRIEAGRMGVDATVFDFGEVVAQVDASLRPAARAKQLAFVCETHPARLPFYGDRRKCLRVVRHLADNALKFTQQGEVRITAGFDGADLLVTVADTGIGISAEQQPSLFEAFRQLDASPRRAHGGAGLGLYLSRKLVEMMGGTIAVESTPQAGSRFTVRLPQRREA